MNAKVSVQVLVTLVFHENFHSRKDFLDAALVVVGTLLLLDLLKRYQETVDYESYLFYEIK